MAWTDALQVLFRAVSQILLKVIRENFPTLISIDFLII